MTQAEYDAEISVIDQEQHRLRTLLSVAPLVPKDWALSGFTFKAKMDALDRERERLLQVLRYSRFMSSERLKEKRAKKNAKLGANGRKRSEDTWREVPNEAIALAFKHDGYEVACIGTDKWVVRTHARVLG